MTYSIIQKSQLEGALRLDAEYYQPEYLIRIKKLKVFPTIDLEEIAYITDGEHGSPIFDETSGIKYFSAQHVKDGYIDSTNAKNISTIIDERNQRSRLVENDILLSTVGTIGFAGLITKNLLPGNIDRHVARIALKEKDLDPEFLVAFLNSKYGKFQSIRESTGNVQLNLFLSKIRRFKIPKNNSSKISRSVKKALEELENSKKIYFQAKGLLLEKLGLAGEKFEDELSYVMNSSDVKSAGRIDANYFQPKYNKLISKIKQKSKICQLQEIAVVKRGSLIDPKFYNEAKGTPYIRGKDFSTGYLAESNLVYIRKEFLAKNETKVKAGDLVFTSIGSVGALALVKEKFHDSFISNNTGKIAIKDKLIPEYLVLVLQSVVGRLQFEKESTRTAQPKISDSQVKSFKVPILSKSTQQKIANLIRQSHQARRKSKQLLEGAKKEVEGMIEKSSN